MSSIFMPFTLRWEFVAFDGLPPMRLTIFQIFFIGIWLLIRETNAFQLLRLFSQMHRQDLVLNTHYVAEHGFNLNFTSVSFISDMVFLHSSLNQMESRGHVRFQII
jgi:hypothetical protein